MDLNPVEALLTGPAVLERADWRNGDAFLAGGTWLFSEPQPELRRLRDLTTLSWPSLSVDPAGLHIAATCTLAELDAFEPPSDWAAGPLLRSCCRALLGSFKIRDQATVGGNLCLALPAGPMTSLAAGLDGTCLLWAADGGRRLVPAAAFVTGVQRTVLAPGELLREVLLPLAALRSRTAFRSFSVTTGGRSAGLVIGRRTPDGGLVVTVTASTPAPLQLRFPGLPAPDDLLAALRAAAPTWYDDPHGTPLWRRDLTELAVDEVREELA